MTLDALIEPTADEDGNLLPAPSVTLAQTPATALAESCDAWWRAIRASGLRLQAGMIARGRAVGGGNPQAVAAQLRQAADALHPAGDPIPSRPVAQGATRPAAIREWLRGVGAVAESEGAAAVTLLPHRQPTGAHDAVPLGSVQLDGDGDPWISVVPDNVWPIGGQGWRRYMPDGSPAPWVQPLGAVDAYQLGDVVDWQGAARRSTFDGANVWPPDNDAFWEDADGGGEVDEWPDWVQPTGAHDAYPAGAKVTRSGRRWSSLVAANVWEPSAAVPTLWRDEGPV